MTAHQRRRLFALMTEGLGMAGTVRTPVVVVEAQRVGP